MSDPPVRPATAADHAPITAFTRDTFHWGDYVPERFPTWLDAQDSQVFVATDAADEPIAVARVVQLSPDEVWLHAARVHPDHRRRGLGSALNRASQQWGRERGAVVAGLLTSTDNEAAMAQVADIGYREVAQWFFGRRSLEPGEHDPAGVGLDLAEPPQQVSVAPAVDIEPAYLTWQSSELATAAHGLIPLDWSLRRMRVDDLVEAARRRTLYEAPAGWVVIGARGDEAWVPWLVTIPDDAFSFLRAITARLSTDGHREAGLFLPRVPWLEVAAERAGYEVHPQVAWQAEIV